LESNALLVAPLAMKFDVPQPLNPLLKLATKAFENADIIVVVGYSFAEADLYISRMLTKSMQSKPDQKLLLVDPDESIVTKVRKKFEVSIHKFDPKRIIKISGDCAKELPKFLAGELYKKKSPTISRHNGHITKSVTLRRRSSALLA